MGMAIQAAVHGQGIALTSVVSAMDEIRAGRLFAPFGTTGVFKTKYGYDLVYSAALEAVQPSRGFPSVDQSRSGKDQTSHREKNFADRWVSRLSKLAEMPFAARDGADAPDLS